MVHIHNIDTAVEFTLFTFVFSHFPVRLGLQLFSRACRPSTPSQTQSLLYRNDFLPKASSHNSALPDFELKDINLNPA